MSCDDRGEVQEGESSERLREGSSFGFFLVLRSFMVSSIER